MLLVNTEIFAGAIAFSKPSLLFVVPPFISCFAQLVFEHRLTTYWYPCLYIFSDGLNRWAHTSVSNFVSYSTQCLNYLTTGSFPGLMPYNFVCVHSGSILRELESFSDIFTWTRMFQMAIIACVALIPSLYLKKFNKSSVTPKKNSSMTANTVYSTERSSS